MKYGLCEGKDQWHERAPRPMWPCCQGGRRKRAGCEQEEALLSVCMNYKPAKAYDEQEI